jgi:hypothetical protein
VLREVCQVAYIHFDLITLRLRASHISAENPGKNWSLAFLRYDSDRIKTTPQKLFVAAGTSLLCSYPAMEKEYTDIHKHMNPIIILLLRVFFVSGTFTELLPSNDKTDTQPDARYLWSTMLRECHDICACQVIWRLVQVLGEVKKTKTLWSESASELYRRSGCQLLRI